MRTLRHLRQAQELQLVWRVLALQSPRQVVPVRPLALHCVGPLIRV